MIIKKNDDRNLLPTDVIGSSVARSKRWLVAIVAQSETLGDCVKILIFAS